MDDAGMRRALSIFHAVVDLEPAEQTSAVAAAVGADTDLATQVRAMLAADASFADPHEGVTLAAGLEVGAEVDRYVVRGRLGQGGAAEVYAVEHRTLRTKHALKVLHSASSSLAPRLMEEGRIQARLRHPHIVRVTDVVPVGAGVGLVMDLVPGRSLRESLDTGGIPPTEALRVAEQVLSGVAAAHAAGLVHRDLKPDNILLEDTPAGTHARVADFGIARASVSADRPRTRTGVAMGTPGYMAPEQYRDAGRVGPQADVFSLACLIQEALTGRPAFAPGDLIEMFRQAERGLFARVAGVPAPVADVLARALSPDPERRFSDAGEMLSAWRRACLGGSAPRPTPAAAGHSLPTMSFDGLGGPKADTPTRAASQLDTLEAVVRTLLLTDVVDSTAMAESLGDARMASVWLAHDRVARDLLPIHNGLEIDKTDGFLLLFEDTPSAVAYAVAYHAAMRVLSAELEVRLAARAGVHRGPVILRENGAADVARGAKPIEVEGLAKPTAARTMSVAGAGQTLMTSAASETLGEVDLTVRSHGHWRLKGVALPVELLEVGDDDAPFLPPEDGAKVYRVVEVGGEWRPARDVPNNLPPVMQASFGRVRELRDIGDAFDRGARLVTLLGPGGTGKTHLALRHARAWRGDHPGGTWLCDLSEARTPAEVARTFGVALGVPLDAGDPLETLGAALASRGRVLLVVDNLEQVEVEPEALLGGLLRAAPEARLLATSRHRLGVRGEHLLPLEPLPLPVGDGPVQDSPAVAMFIDRARAASPRLKLDPASLRVIGRLVNLLDGLPLAIELAAARVRVLSPARILERMGRRLDVLKRRGGPTRQATLRAAIDGSWELLSPVERAAFAACAVFEGSFDLEAAEAIFDFEAWPEAPWADEVLESLVDKSLVRSRDVDGELRFSLFRHLHDYATERMTDPQSARTPDGEAATGPAVRAELEERHAEHY
jgi:predicted ATPase/class 3 adenylate cyclase